MKVRLGDVLRECKRRGIRFGQVERNMVDASYDFVNSFIKPYNSPQGRKFVQAYEALKRENPELANMMKPIVAETSKNLENATNKLYYFTLNTLEKYAREK